MVYRSRWIAALANLGMILVLLASLARADDAPADDAAPADGATIALDLPGQREFVRDLAHLMAPADEDEVKRIAGNLLDDKHAPIIVVTIGSMAEGSSIKMRIETFARLLFDQWEIGSAAGDGEWNRGILLLVSKGDRKARIELGRTWRRDQDRQCQRIMQEQIIPRFKRNDYSGGILAGVQALDRMARGHSDYRAAPPRARAGTPPTVAGVPPAAQFPRYVPPPMPPRFTPRSRMANFLPAVVLILIALGVLIVFGLAVAAGRQLKPGRNHVGDNSWWNGPMGWQNWALYEMSRQNWQSQQQTPSHPVHSSFDGMSHGGGGGFSPMGGGGSFDAGSVGGGSFDGGSSGGGGATGSW